MSPCPGTLGTAGAHGLVLAGCSSGCGPAALRLALISARCQVPPPFCGNTASSRTMRQCHGRKLISLQLCGCRCTSEPHVALQAFTLHCCWLHDTAYDIFFVLSSPLARRCGVKYLFWSPREQSGSPIEPRAIVITVLTDLPPVHPFCTKPNLDPQPTPPTNHLVSLCLAMKRRVGPRARFRPDGTRRRTQGELQAKAEKREAKQREHKARAKALSGSPST